MYAHPPMVLWRVPGIAGTRRRLTGRIATCCLGCPQWIPPREVRSSLFFLPRT